jgi:acetylornithine/LysW-gamma-L-lysine aminotransferase
MDCIRNLDSQIIREVRGLGLMIGIDLRKPARLYLDQLRDRGVLALQAGTTVLRLLPPLTISRDQLAAVSAALKSVLTSNPPT